MFGESEDIWIDRSKRQRQKPVHRFLLNAYPTNWGVPVWVEPFDKPFVQ
jgi:hypothetical protein